MKLIKQLPWKHLILLILFTRAENVYGRNITINPGTSSAEINQTIKEMRPGDNLLFTRGKYRISDTVYLKNKSGISIDAEKGAEIVLGKNNSVVLYILNSDNISVKNLKAMHEIPIHPGEFCVAGVILVNSSHDILLENLELNGSGTHGIQVFDSGSLVIRNCFLHHNSVSAIGLYDRLDNILIERSIARNNPRWIETNISDLADRVIFRDNQIDPDRAEKLP